MILDKKLKHVNLSFNLYEWKANFNFGEYA